MADREQLYTALRNADAAGDTAAAQKLAAYIQSLPADTPAPTGAAAIPVSADERAFGARQAVQQPAPQDNMLGKAFGMIEPAIAMGTGAIGSALGSIAGVSKSIIGGHYGTQQGVQEGDQLAGKVADALTYQPRTQTGQAIVGKVGDALNSSGIAGLPIGGELMAATHLTAPAVRAAAPAVKSAIAPEVFMAKNAARKVASLSAVPRINQETAQLANKAHQFGMTLTPDMLSDNKIARIGGEALAKVPLSGAPADANQVAFNRSLIGMIGGDTTARALTPDVYGNALEQAGGKIGDISSKTQIPLDQSFSDALAGHVNDAAKFQTEDVANVVNNYVQELQNKAAQNGGVIDGTAFRTLNSKIGRQMRGTTNGDLRNALGDLQDSMHNALQANISDPADLSALLAARKQYAIAKTIEPLVAKSPTGNISPAGLMNRVTSNGIGKTAMATGNAGDLGDLARVGQRFLKEPNSSNTAERGLAYGILGGGAIANLPTTAGVFTAANLYNRLSPILARKMVQKSLPPTVPPVSFPPEGLSLMEESPFKPRPPAPVPEVPYRGLISLADQNDIASRAPVPDTQRLATTHDYPTMDFPLRQEVLQQPEIASAIDDFRAEAARLVKIKDNAISPAVRAKAASDLATLQNEFAAGMRQLGISNAADAHGLNRPLYEAGAGTRLPIKKTFTPLSQLPRKQ